MSAKLYNKKQKKIKKTEKSIILRYKEKLKKEKNRKKQGARI